MANKTAIEWTDLSWNPVHGCSKVSPNAEENVILKPHKLLEPLSGGKLWSEPKLVFVNSTSDLFHELVPEDYIARVFTVMRRAERHTFQVLTKRAERMRDVMNRLAWRTPTTAEREDTSRPWWQRTGLQAYMLPEPFEKDGRLPVYVCSNVWLGTSIENRRYVHRADLLRETPTAVRFISAEPLLGPLIAFPNGGGTYWASGEAEWPDGYFGKELDLAGINWLIVGGESGAGHRPMRVEWVRDLRAACRCYICGGKGRRSTWVNELGREIEGKCPDCDGTGALTAFFFKQWGGRTPKAAARELDGRIWDEMPAAASK